MNGRGRAKAADGKSAKTIRNALGLLHSIFEFGQRKGWAKSNPCKLIDKPRDEGEPDIRFLDAEELSACHRRHERGWSTRASESKGETQPQNDLSIYALCGTPSSRIEEARD